MGDIPEYYVIAKNLFFGRGFVQDYFIGDFWTGPKTDLQNIIGSVPTSARRPLVPYLASYYYYIVGQNNFFHICR